MQSANVGKKASTWTIVKFSEIVLEKFELEIDDMSSHTLT